MKRSRLKRRRRLSRVIGEIKYHKPRWDIADIDIGEHLTFKWGKRWKVIGKTESGYLKLKKVKD